MDHLINHPVILGVFSIIIIAMLLLDLGVLNKKSHAISNREAAIWSVTWISLAMGFSGIIYYYLGAEQFMQFQGAYWIEKALSVDNLFVFIFWSIDLLLWKYIFFITLFNHQLFNYTTKIIKI